MLCISLWQPWASLWACGAKIHETRAWPVPAKIDGRALLGATIAIHAAKRVERAEAGARLAEICRARWGAGWERILPRGAVVGTGRLTACWRTGERYRSIGADEEALGNWSPGRYAWQLADAKPLLRPVPWRGQQGWFEVSDDALTAPPAAPMQRALP